MWKHRKELESFMGSPVMQEILLRACFLFIYGAFALSSRSHLMVTMPQLPDGVCPSCSSVEGITDHILKEKNCWFLGVQHSSDKKKAVWVMLGTDGMTQGTWVTVLLGSPHCLFCGFASLSSPFFSVLSNACMYSSRFFASVSLGSIQSSESQEGLRVMWWACLGQYVHQQCLYLQD